MFPALVTENNSVLKLNMDPAPREKKVVFPTNSENASLLKVE
jgi:hypothetical protein